MYNHAKCAGALSGRGSGGHGLKIIHVYMYIEAFFVDFGISCAVIFI